MEKLKLYEMEMKFTLTLGIKEINNFMEKMGFAEKTGVNGYNVIISQTVPFIPDENYIKQVADVIKAHYDKTLDVLSCTFAGYNKFLEKEIDVTN